MTSKHSTMDIVDCNLIYHTILFSTKSYHTSDEIDIFRQIQLKK